MSPGPSKSHSNGISQGPFGVDHPPQRDSHEARHRNVRRGSLGIELRRQLWAYVRELNAGGVTVVLTTHYLEEAEELCDRIAIINHGKVVANEPTRTLVAKAQEKAVVVTFDHDLDEVPSDACFEDIRLLDERSIEITYRKDKCNAGDVLAAVQRDGFAIIDVRTRDPSRQAGVGLHQRHIGPDHLTARGLIELRQQERRDGRSLDPAYRRVMEGRLDQQVHPRWILGDRCRRRLHEQQSTRTQTIELRVHDRGSRMWIVNAASQR